jgi:hypothetical protein
LGGEPSNAQRPVRPSASQRACLLIPLRLRSGSASAKLPSSTPSCEARDAGGPNIDKLREALTLRAAEWRKTLREEPKVARVLLRRLVVPLTLVDPEDFKAFIEWETSLTPAILEGLAPIYR